MAFYDFFECVWVNFLETWSSSSFLNVLLVSGCIRLDFYFLSVFIVICFILEKLYSIILNSCIFIVVLCLVLITVSQCVFFLFGERFITFFIQLSTDRKWFILVITVKVKLDPYYYESNTTYGANLKHWFHHYRQFVFYCNLIAASWIRRSAFIYLIF